jgi:hypothetical protein
MVFTSFWAWGGMNGCMGLPEWLARSIDRNHEDKCQNINSNLSCVYWTVVMGREDRWSFVLPYCIRQDSTHRTKRCYTSFVVFDTRRITCCVESFDRILLFAH